MLIHFFISILMSFSWGVERLYERAYINQRQACGVLLDGKVECWGDRIFDWIEEAPEYIRNPTKIVFDNVRTCAVVDEKLTCWGRENPFRDIALTNLQDIAMLNDILCAVLKDGTLECMDSLENSMHRLSDNKFEKVVMDYKMICGITTPLKQLECWGEKANVFNEKYKNIMNIQQMTMFAQTICVAYLEKNSSKFSTSCIHQNGKEVGLPIQGTAPAKALAYGYNGNTCVIDGEDSLVCSGSIAIPSNITKVKDLVASENRFCVVRMDSQRQCFGTHISDLGTNHTISSYNDIIDFTMYGWGGLCYLLKDGTTDCFTLSRSELIFNNISNAVSLYGAYGSLCYIDKDQKVVCGGELEKNYPAPKLQKIKKMSVMDSSACAIDVDNTLTCWGKSEHIHIPSSIKKAEVVSLSTFNSCVANSSVLQCWGKYPSRFNYPKKEIKEVVAGGSVVCSRFSDGTVQCESLHESWDIPTPDLKDIQTLVGGLHHFCALSKVGELSCWGVYGSGPSRGEIEIPKTLQNKKVLKVYANDQGVCAVTNELVQCFNSSRSSFLYFNTY